MSKHDSAQYDDQFSSLERLYGRAAYRLLPKLHLCVIGLGGVGSWAAEAITRTGIGTITLIDFDSIEKSNINRQIIALNSTLKQKKCEVLAARLHDINPGCTIHVVDDYLTETNMNDLLSADRNYDYVVDAIDSIRFKAALIAHCKRNKIPVISTGGAGGLDDPTRILVADLSKTYNDPLAAKVRSHLRQKYGFTKDPKKKFGVECVFSSQQQVYPKPDGSVGHEKPGIHGVSLDCRFGYGSVTFVTGCFGFFAASRAINKALERRLRLDAE